MGGQGAGIASFSWLLWVWGASCNARTASVRGHQVWNGQTAQNDLGSPSALCENILWCPDSCSAVFGGSEEVCRAPGFVEGNLDKLGMGRFREFPSWHPTWSPSNQPPGNPPPTFYWKRGPKTPLEYWCTPTFCRTPRNTWLLAGASPLHTHPLG